MFYGSGAGKLPTASAVVADVIDAAKHLHKSVMTNWTNEKMHLMPQEKITGRFFVRIKEDQASPEDVQAVLGEGTVVRVEHLTGEFGFITSEMTQGEYEQKAEKLGSAVITMIRVKD